MSCATNVSSGVLSGAFTLPAVVPTFYPVSAITDSNLARFGSPITSQFASLSAASSLPNLSYSASGPISKKAFIVGPGHAPIPAKLAKKIIEGQFVELADLLTVNLCAVEEEPQTFLEGKLLVSNAKRRQVSFSEHPSVIHSYLQNEGSFSRVAGPFPAPPFPLLHIHVSRFGE